MSLASVAHHWNPEPIGGDQLAELIERVAALEAHVTNIREGQDRLELKTDHLDTKLDFHAQETSKALQEIKIGIAERNSASKERSRNIAVAGAALGTAATAIIGFAWTYGAKAIAWLAAVVVK